MNRTKQLLIDGLLIKLNLHLDRVLRIRNATEITDEMINDLGGLGKARKRVVVDLLSGMMKEVEKHEEKFIDQIDVDEKLKRGFHLRHSEIFEGEMIVFNKDDFKMLISTIKTLAEHVKR